MSRLFGRPARIVTGPLRALPAAEAGSVPVTAVALAAAVIAAGLALIPQLSRQSLAAPSPVAEIAQPTLTKPRVVATIAAPPAPLAQPIAAMPAAAVAEPAPVASVIEPALFQLDALPVLQADGSDLGLGATAPKPAARPVVRRIAGSRGAVMAVHQP